MNAEDCCEASLCFYDFPVLLQTVKHLLIKCDNLHYFEVIKIVTLYIWLLVVNKQQRHCVSYSV